MPEMQQHRLTGVPRAFQPGQQGEVPVGLCLTFRAGQEELHHNKIQQTRNVSFFFFYQCLFPLPQHPQAQLSAASLHFHLSKTILPFAAPNLALTETWD